MLKNRVISEEELKISFCYLYHKEYILLWQVGQIYYNINNLNLDFKLDFLICSYLIHIV